MVESESVFLLEVETTEEGLCQVARKAIPVGLQELDESAPIDAIISTAVFAELIENLLFVHI